MLVSAANAPASTADADSDAVVGAWASTAASAGSAALLESRAASVSAPSEASTSAAIESAVLAATSEAELSEVVPRAWTHLLAEATGAAIPPHTEVPGEWQAYVTSTYGLQAPTRMTDGGTSAWRDWSEGYDPADAVDRAVLATQRAVFPPHGLGGLLDL